MNLFRLFCALSCLSLIACQEKIAGGDSAFALKTTTLHIGNQTVVAEVADTPQTMETGLMYRTSLEPVAIPASGFLGKILDRSTKADHGMIFVFDSVRRASFWMHNTDLPLDIAYLDAAGKLREVHAATPHDDTPIPSATSDIAYALEMNQGWFHSKNIPLGTSISGLPKPSTVP